MKLSFPTILEFPAPSYQLVNLIVASSSPISKSDRILLLPLCHRIVVVVPSTTTSPPQPSPASNPSPPPPPIPQSPVGVEARIDHMLWMKDESIICKNEVVVDVAVDLCAPLELPVVFGSIRPHSTLYAASMCLRHRLCTPAHPVADTTSPNPRHYRRLC
ncbi:hypothetical protein PR202_gb23809 [Eleusine coracana subsp. coracana]|uniref:Uncharacterized protein n=1 Tax=Eleusine coracana subsp. coracana TaxID=191504 RepID=A0AAV5FJW5_ELECO|nr:hypothetical protein PR202_gb23809 [Eleusine coracana subsp. coracana]